jgi:hypothetical protein
MKTERGGRSSAPKRRIRGKSLARNRHERTPYRKHAGQKKRIVPGTSSFTQSVLLGTDTSDLHKAMATTIRRESSGVDHE